MDITREQLAKMIDHTLLKPTAVQQEIIQLCSEAREFGFASVCVNPCHVPLAVEQLKDSAVRVCTVIGFPLGSSTAETKAFETADAVKKGAEEVDMVINIGALKQNRQDAVYNDIKAVVEAAKKNNADAITKVIIETCYLTKEEKVLACRLSKEAGADYVKTSTGFGSGGATVEDVALMRETVGADMGVKASGGIKNTEQAIAMINAGATRIGASAGIDIVKNL